MAIILDGTTGITTPGLINTGSETVVNLSTTGTTTLGDASGDALTINSSAVSIPNGLNFDSNTFVIDATNNRVGVGTASPSGAKLHVVGSTAITPIKADSAGNTQYGVVFQGRTTGGSDAPAISLENNNGGSPVRYGISVTSSGAMAFSSGLYDAALGTERMRIDSSGRLLIRSTSGTGNEVLSVWFNSGGGVTTTQGINLLDTNASANGSSFIVFRKSDEANIGTITRNGTSNAVLYNTTSDYRLKENVQPLSGALAKVSRLRPVTWKWKDCDANGEGFIAHEVQEVVPSAVTGKKDAVDENGKPDYQGMDASYLVATLTAAIQEQQAIITDLKARIEAIESK